MSGYTSSLYDDSCASRETSSLSVQLAENNPGPVGPEYNSGLHDRLCVTATSTISTPASTILCGADTADLHGDHRTSTEKCNRESDTPPTTGLLFKSLPYPQERLRTTLGNQPESVEQVCAKRTFQDGGYPHSKGPPETRRLASQSRLEGCLFSVPIDYQHRKFLRFIFKRKTYQFNCLPFGMSSAPWVFTKTLKPVLAVLRERGVRLIAYVDDILILAESRDLIQDQVTGMLYLLECLGFIVDRKKSILNPTQVIEFLGLSVDSIAMKLRLPLIKMKHIRAEARKLARETSVSALL